MSGALAGLEHYAPAPEAVEAPGWLLHEEKLWARVNDECRPVVIERDGEERWKLEVTTCIEEPITCSVMVRSEADEAIAHPWCGSGTSSFGPVDGDRLRLVAADDAHAAFTRIVALTVVPVGLRGELHSCTGRSLRELERRGEPPATVADEAPDPMEVLREHRFVWMGNRVCLFVEGFAVEEAMHRPPIDWPEGTWHAASVPGRWDCTEPCPSRPRLEEYFVHLTTVAGRDFLPPRPRGLDLFRTAEACMAMEDPPPSVLARDLGPLVGRCLRTDGRPPE
jgi:hypothetical protein